MSIFMYTALTLLILLYTSYRRADDGSGDRDRLEGPVTSGTRLPHTDHHTLQLLYH